MAVSLPAARRRQRAIEPLHSTSIVPLEMASPTAAEIAQYPRVLTAKEILGNYHAGKGK
jgi:hypothetical protein